jgi:hypothetical protein
MMASLLLPSNSVVDGRLETQCVHELSVMSAEIGAAKSKGTKRMVWIPFLRMRRFYTTSLNANVSAGLSP